MPDTPPPTMRAEERQSLTRIRIEHSHTIKNGWGYSTTVEIQYPSSSDLINRTEDLDGMSRLASLLADARLIAEEERDIRNLRDAERSAP